jgi:hypothetical protein
MTADLVPPTLDEATVDEKNPRFVRRCIDLRGLFPSVFEVSASFQSDGLPVLTYVRQR